VTSNGAKKTVRLLSPFFVYILKFEIQSHLEAHLVAPPLSGGREISQIAEITVCYSNVLKNIRIATKQKKQVV